MRMCAIVGADADSSMVDDDNYLVRTFQYYPDNLWRTLGLIFLIMAAFALSVCSQRITFPVGDPTGKYSSFPVMRWRL